MYFVCFIFLRETLEDLNKNQKKLKKFELDVEKFQQDLSKVFFKFYVFRVYSYLIKLNK